MRRHFASIVFLGLVSMSIPLVSYAAAPQNLVELANMLAKMFNGGASFLVFLAFIIYLGGVTMFIYKKGAGEVWGKEFRSLVLWGLLAFFIMVSIWGIIRLLQNTLFGSRGSIQSQDSGSAPLNFPNSTVLGS